MKAVQTSSRCGCPPPYGEIILVIDAYDIGAGGILYQCQVVDPAELAQCQNHTSGLNLDDTLKHDYPANGWRLVPFRHWNWKLNQARSN